MSEEVLSDQEVDALMESSGDDGVLADDLAREYRRFDITAREQGMVNRMRALGAIRASGRVNSSGARKLDAGVCEVSAAACFFV